ncbi:aminoacyl-tRNA hydrolase [Tenuibacillus multivorans]|uniref:Peptidyl-tRNA hydrolase n=1 Tax=Tenuibacillus multivorans TaxID=237069 RepID=A0A1G9VZD1_9BACI|nr:aminoacyl-tRNA hydrolase [Tenuibacillus multivorans]GEL78258.1 peptidyl-tRNA hydrolase [Tenuibacillus multivorans]SDM77649.1 peptidyl-tRNA hydrolase, PTH1 family [Tenuibacillus multivorans]
MKCIVGLGNPGFKYRKTRHNIGFMTVDHMASENGWKINKSGFESNYAEEHWKGEKIILVKPQTYMNLSGQAVKKIVDYYSIDPQDILVIYDDLDLPSGKIRLRQKGGHGGHNGIRSIIDQLGTKEFNRIRFGIGRPETNMDIIDYVLGKFSKNEKQRVEPAIEQSLHACEDWMEKPFLEVMNTYN